MLKRQRPATPPPSSFGDPISFLPTGLTRPLQPTYTTDPSQPRSKRQRIQPPPLDGTLRGWLGSGFAGPQWESDGEEDWTEEVDDASSLPLSLSATAGHYKDANNLLHELHVLNQHRLLFVHPPPCRDRYLNSGSRIPPATTYHQAQNPLVEQRLTTWTDGPPHHPAFPCLPHDGPDGQSYLDSAGEKGLVEEVQCVRQRYEDANKILGSLFLLRRREVEGVSFSPSPSS